jgi:outer membrane protein TolC
MFKKSLFSLLAFSLTVLPTEGNITYANQQKEKILTIQEALSLATKRNLQIKAQYSKYESDKYKFYSQIGQRFGQITLFWKYTQYRFPRIVAPVEPTQQNISTITLGAIKIQVSNTQNNLPVDDQVRVYGFQYSVRLFDGCQQFFLIKAKKYQAETSYAQLIKTSKDIQQQVKEVYLKALSLKAQIQAMEEKLKATRQLYKTIYEAYKVGKKPLLDLLNVKAELKNIEGQIVQLKSQLKSQKHLLATLLDLNTNNFHLKDVKITPKPVDSEKLLSQLIANNPDLQVISEQKKVAQAYEKAALAEFAPKVDFVYTLQKYVYADKSTFDWFYGFQISVPFFDFGKRFFDYKSAHSIKRQVNYLQQQTVKNVIETYKSLIDQLNAQIDIINASHERVEFTKKAYQIEKNKYRLGKTDIYNLLEAQALYFSALAQYRANIYEWGILKAKLDYLLGK